MISLLFVGDGELDGAVVPPIVERLLGVKIKQETKHWAEHFHRGGKGYERKLLFALRQAKDLQARGVVATVDRDKAKRRTRLQRLREGREDHRKQHPPLPTVLAEAAPHAEAWLLDDPVAVREVLRLDPATAVPSVRDANDPKGTLSELQGNSARAGESRAVVWREIACCVVPSRCQHKRETGFDDLENETRRELGPLVRAE